MKRKRGLFRLMNDCKQHHIVAKKRKPRDPSEEDSFIEDAQIIESQSTEEAYYDFGEPLSMSNTTDFHSEYTTEEASSYDYSYQEADKDSYERAYSSSDYPYEEAGEDSEAFYVEPFESKPERETIPIDIDQPVQEIHKKQKLKGVSPAVEPKHTSQPSKPSLEINKNDLEEDIKAIIEQQKNYDAYQKKMAPTEAARQRQVQKPRQQSEEQSVDDMLKNEHQIFDKIAQSMKMANAYDLGSIALEQRLDSFDQEMKDEEKKKKSLDNYPGQKIVPMSVDLGTDEFLSDLDKMTQQNTIPASEVRHWETETELAEGQTKVGTYAFTAGNNKVKVFKNTHNQQMILHYKTEMAVEGDGAPQAYHPDHSQNGGGLEGWGNGGIKEVIQESGKYYVHGKGKDSRPYAIVIDEDDHFTRSDKKYYRAYVQGTGDPAPGYFFSTTALVQAGKKATDIGRFVNAATTPFISLTDWKKFRQENAEKGDFASIYCCRTKNLVHAIIGDVGGGDLGEGSMFLAQKLLGQSNAPTYQDRRGNTRLSSLHEDIIYIIYPNSGSTSQIPSKHDIINTGQRLFDKWGGMNRLQSVYPDCFK